MKTYTAEDVRMAVMQTIKQGRQCMIDGNECIYNGPNGMHCVVGWMVRDNEDVQLFISTVDNCSAQELIDEDLFRIQDGLSLCILSDIQDTHDYFDVLDGRQTWLGKFNSDLERYNIKPVTMEEVEALE